MCYALVIINLRAPCVLIAPVPNFLSGQAFGVELFAASVEQGDVITQTGIRLIPNSCPNTQQLYDEEKLVILAVFGKHLHKKANVCMEY